MVAASLLLLLMVDDEDRRQQPKPIYLCHAAFEAKLKVHDPVVFAIVHPKQDCDTSTLLHTAHHRNVFT